MSSGPFPRSNSALTTLQNCGEKYRRKYLEREVFPASPKQLRGTVVHRLAARSLRQKMVAQTLPSLEEVRDVAATEFDAGWRSGVLLTPEEQSQGKAAVQAESKDFAIGLSAYHRTNLAPRITPVAVERRITVKPTHSDLEILGVIDLIDQTPEGRVVRDLKTSERTPPKDAAEKSQQLTMYALLHLAEMGTLPAWLALDTLVRTPIEHRESRSLLQTTRDAADLDALVARLDTAMLAVTRGVFIPADPSSWWGCSPTYCEYWSTCPYTRRTVRPKA